MPKRPTKAQKKSALLKEALDSLGIKGKRRSNPITTAMFLDFTPKRSGKVLAPSKTGYYAEAVEREIFKRFANDKQPLSRSITLNYTFRFKKEATTAPPRKATKSITIVGTRKTIGNLVQEQIDAWNDELEQDSPVIIIGKEEAQVGDTMVLSFDKKQNKFVSKGVRHIRMKKLGALKLDYNYIGDTSWDRQQDTCVFDWLFYEYADKSGFKKFLPKDDRDWAYDNLNHLFKDFDGVGNPLTEGVNIEQLERFAEKFRLPMMAFDKTEKIICSYRPDKINKEVKPLMFIIANSHLYPIDDKSKRLSMSSKVREDKKDDEDKFGNIQNWKSDDFEEAPKDEAEEGKELPPPIYTDGELVGNEYVMSIIKETKTIPSKIQVEGSNIVRFNIGDQKYLTNKQTDLEERVEKYVREKGEIYWGQSPNYLMSELYQEIFEKTKEVCCGSRLSPAVYELFMDEKIKHRQHYGATRDNTALMELVEEEFEEVIEEKEIETQYKDIFTGELKKKKEIIKLRQSVAKPRKSVIERMFEEGKAVCYDLNKHYTSCLYDPYDEFLTYDEEDNIYTFNCDITKPLPTGIYYVETDDLTLLHQSNWYSNKILDLAIKEKIKLKIKYEFLPVQRYNGEENKVYPKDYFKTFIDKAYETPFGKEIVNIFIGCLGRTTQKSKVVECDTDVDLVWDCFVNCEKPKNEDDYDHLFFKDEYEAKYNRLNKKNIILQNINTDEEPLYLYGHNTIKGQNEIALPIWIQLLDWSNMRLYNMSKKVGGETIFRKTDCIVSLGGKVGLSQEGFNNFKSAEWEHLKLTSQQRTDRHYNSWNWKSSWKTHTEYNSSSDWRKIIELAKEQGGLLIEGRAGTGKSYIPHQAFNEGILKIDEDTASASFTNKAGRAIRGKTLHKLLKITKNDTIPKKTLDSLRKYKYFVIDEIGMIATKYWRLLKLVKQSHPKSIWIMMGDYRQLPPIEDHQRVGNKLDVFNLPIVKYLANYNKVELTEKQRYDTNLWDYLESGFNKNYWRKLPSRTITPDEIYTGKAICYTNATRDRVNDECMNYFQKDTPSMFIPYERKDDEKPKDIWIYDGLPVMAYNTCKDLEIVNSEEFIVIGYDDNKITLKRDVDDLPNVEINTDDFHSHFVCNYCSTTHKSQGATYQGNIYIFDWGRIQLDKNIAYTACSRGTALDKLIVAEKIKK